MSYLMPAESYNHLKSKKLITVLILTILVILALVVFIILKGLDPINLVIIPIVCGVGSSIIFFLVIELRTAALSKEVFEKQFQVGFGVIVQNLEGNYKEFIPNEVFDARVRRSSAFEKAIRKDLAETKMYAFKGNTGKRSLLRLDVCCPETNFDDINFTILNPSSTGQFHKIGSSKARKYLHKHKSQWSPKKVKRIQEHETAIINDFIEALIQENITVIWGLFNLRERSKKGVVVVLTSQDAESRVELCSSSIYTTLYEAKSDNSNEGGDELFPETWRHVKDSKFYRLMRPGLTPYFITNEEVSTKEFTFSQQTTSIELEKILKSIRSNFSLAELEDIEKHYTKQLEYFKDGKDPEEELFLGIVDKYLKS